MTTGKDIGVRSKRTGLLLADLQSRWDSIDTNVGGLQLPSSTGWGRLTAQINQRDNPMVKESRFLKSTEFRDLVTAEEECFGAATSYAEIDNTALADIRGEYGVSPSYITGLRRLARKYLQSFPGRDSLSPNTMLHQQCSDLLARQREFSPSELGRIESALQYRMGMSCLANQLVVGFSVPLPQGVPCDEWDEDNKFSYGQKERSSLFHRLLSLFPSANPNQGAKGWTKPYWYIVAALIEAGLSPSQVDRKIQQLFEAVEGVRQTQEDRCVDIIKSK